MTIKIKNRHRLKTRDITDIITKIHASYHHDFFEKTASLETGEIENYSVIIVNDSIDFVVINNQPVLTVRAISKYNLTKQRVVVDMGAIRFVTNGADIMAAGIVDADPDIQVNDPVWICDETHHKPLAVGVALLTGPEMKTSKTGKAVKNLHYVGDMLWVLTKPI